MHSTFKSNLRTKSSEQLLNMVANRSSWNEEQYLLILNEVENRGISTPEIDEYNEEMSLVDSDEDYQSEFDKDLEIINEAETKEVEKEKYYTFGLVSGLIITFFFAFTLFGGFSLIGIENRFTDAYIFTFINYIFLIIIWFFLVWGLFIGKQYLFSIITNGGLVLFLIIMSLINY